MKQHYIPAALLGILFLGAMPPAMAEGPLIPSTITQWNPAQVQSIPSPDGRFALLIYGDDHESPCRLELKATTTGEPRLLTGGIDLIEHQWLDCRGRQILVLRHCVRETEDYSFRVNVEIIDARSGKLLFTSRDIPKTEWQEHWHVSTARLAEGVVGIEGPRHVRLVLDASPEAGSPVPFKEVASKGYVTPAPLHGWQLQRDVVERDGTTYNKVYAAKGDARLLLFTSRAEVAVVRNIGDYWICEETGSGWSPRTVYVVRVDEALPIPTLVYLSQNPESRSAMPDSLKDAKLQDGRLQVSIHREYRDFSGKPATKDVSFTLPEFEEGRKYYGEVLPYIGMTAHPRIISGREGRPAAIQELPDGKVLVGIDVGSGLYIPILNLCVKTPDGGWWLADSTTPPWCKRSMAKPTDDVFQPAAVTTTETVCSFYREDGSRAGGMDVPAGFHATSVFGKGFGVLSDQEFTAERVRDERTGAARYYFGDTTRCELIPRDEATRQALEARWKPGRETARVHAIVYETIQLDGAVAIPEIDPKGTPSECGWLKLPESAYFTPAHKIIIHQVLPPHR